MASDEHPPEAVPDVPEARYGAADEPCAMEAVERLHGLPEGEREAFLERYCAGDRSLRVEILALFEGSKLVGELYPSATLEPGMALSDGRYELCQVLGEGGFASVWLARDRRLDKSVAIKVFDPDGSPIARLALFEARAASAVQSDHVRAVLDVSEDGSHGLSYIVMAPCRESGPQGEEADATPLGQTTPQSRREALRWCRDVALGVHAVHEQGLFHGDLKPDNVLILPHSRRAQVIDFGAIGRFVASRADGPGFGLQGTPAYLPPEVASGELAAGLGPTLPDDLPRFVGMDVYGVGAILYEVLTGAPPYAPQPGASDANADVVRQVRRGPPPPLRGRDRSRARFRVSGRLARVVERAMHRNPAMRYPSCRALADDLTALVEGGHASVDRWADTARVWLGRQAPRLLMLGLLLLVLLSQVEVVRVRDRMDAAIANGTMAWVSRQYTGLLDASHEQERLLSRVQERLGLATAYIEGMVFSNAADNATPRSRVGGRAGDPEGGRPEPGGRAPAPVVPSAGTAGPGQAPASAQGLSEPVAPGQPPSPGTSAPAPDAAGPPPALSPHGVVPTAPPTVATPSPAQLGRQGRDALVARLIREVGKSGRRDVLETRDWRGNLTHLWVSGFHMGGVPELRLTRVQRRRLEKVLSRRHARVKHVTGADGKVLEQCTARRVSGSIAGPLRFVCEPGAATGAQPWGVRLLRASKGL